MFRFVFAIVVSAFLTAPLFAQDADAIAGKRVVFLGDSITQAGGYVAFTTYYLERLHPKKDFDILGLGLSSETLSGLSEDGHAGGKFPRPCLFERLGRVLEKAKPDVVFACYGINDGIYQALDKDRFAAFQKGVTKLIEQCKTAGVKQIFLVTPPIYDFTPKKDEFNYDAVMTEYAKWETALKVDGVTVIDLHTAMRKARDARATPFSGDKVHPGEDGQLLIAKTILAALGVKAPDETVATIKADPLFKLVEQKRGLRSAAWMKHVGYTREKTVKPEPLGTAEADAAKVQEKIDALRRDPTEDRPVQVAISPKAGGHVHPSICRTKDGTLVVVYKGANVLMRTRSTDGGKTWEAPETISTTADRPASIREMKTFEIYPGTADALPDGRVVVTWNYIADDKAKDKYYERALLYTVSEDNGKTWSDQRVIGPVDGKHLGAVRHNVLPLADGRWLLPLRVGPPQVYDPKTDKLTAFPVALPDGKAHAFQQVCRTTKGTLLAMGPVFLRSTDDGKTWAEVKDFPAPPDGDNAEGRYLTALADGRVVVTWGVGTANKGLRYNASADDGKTWTATPVTLLPDTAIAARFYSARTVTLDDKHVGTVYLTGSTVHFLKVAVDRLTK